MNDTPWPIAVGIAIGAALVQLGIRVGRRLEKARREQTKEP